MRRVREEGSGNRGIRPRVLIVLGPACSLLLAACSGRASASLAQRADPRAQWFQLTSQGQGGLGTGADRDVQAPARSLEKVDAPRPAGSRARLPWTVQSRIADMSFLDGILYLAVNGLGLASIETEPLGPPRVVYFFDPLIFEHRTITTLVPRQGDLIVHLYYNAMLNDARPSDLVIGGISLVTFLPARSDFMFQIPPFQRKNPEWEAVGFVPVSRDEFLFEWKYTDDSETRFTYTRYRVDTGAETAADREEYIGEFGFPSVTGPGIPAGYSVFFNAVLEELAARQGIPAGTSVHFTLRSRDDPVRRSYRSGAGDSSIVIVPVWEADGSFIALLPRGRIYQMASDGSTRAFSLPGLPKSFQYTGVIEEEGSLVVPWEESLFTEVGSAGILLFSLALAQTPAQEPADAPSPAK